MQESETNVNIYRAFRAITNTDAISYCEQIGRNTTRGSVAGPFEHSIESLGLPEKPNVSSPL
jgi:hypothetical protein